VVCERLKVELPVSIRGAFIKQTLTSLALAGGKSDRWLEPG
jgi:hypothetical protein